jgi:predicted Zn-dependent protease
MLPRLFLGPLAALVLLGIVACQTVPITGRSQLQLLPEPEEVRMGLQAYREILSKSRLSRDPVFNGQVSRVGTRIAQATGKTNYAWEFKVIDDDRQINAFALPGGKVAVYTGLLPVTRDDAGLAAVVGHEVSHAIARHGGERISQQLLIQGGLNLTMAALSKGDPRTVRWVGAALGAGTAVGLILPWSRLQESEADHLGLIYMAKAGYDPHAARDLWVRMSEASRGRARPPEFLSTHPSDVTRIKQIEQWLPEALQYYQASPYRSSRDGEVPKESPSKVASPIRGR